MSSDNWSRTVVNHIQQTEDIYRAYTHTSAMQEVASRSITVTVDEITELGLSDVKCDDELSDSEYEGIINQHLPFSGPRPQKTPVRKCFRVPKKNNGILLLLLLVVVVVVCIAMYTI
jgi:hypothetical protein